MFCIVRDDRAFAVSLLDDGNVRSLRGLRRGWTPGSDVRCRSAIKNHTAPCGPRQLGLQQRPPGSGHVPWGEVAQALRDIDYTGPIVIETFNPRIETIARDAIKPYLH